MRTATFLLAAAALTLAVLATSEVRGVDAQEPPNEAELEAQALQIERQLLCPQCTNKRLDVCELAICRDMKQVIRDRLAAGDEPDEIVFSFSARYGDRVLAELPREGFNLLLFGWVGGSLLAVAMLGGFFLLRLRRGYAEVVPDGVAVAPRRPRRRDCLRDLARHLDAARAARRHVGGRVGSMKGATLLLVALAAAALSSVAAAQERDGRIEGVITAGSAGASIPDGLEVTLLALDGSDVTPIAQTILEGGRYQFEVPADGRLTFLPFVTYQDIRYLGEVVILTPEEQTAVRDLVLFETTRERPELSISISSATVLAIDRGLGQLVIVREDIVENPSDRVYVGGEDDVTVTLPVLDGTIEASGQDAGEGEYRHDGGVMQAAIPLRPGATALRTQYLVAYDRTEDDYRVRLTAPFATDAMELRVPPRFVRDLRALEGASRGEDAVLSGELEGERLLVVERDGPARAGEALLAELNGLSGDEAVLPLTERRGAVVASIIALIVLGGAAAIAIRRDRTPLEALDADEDGTS